jgi:hypothetical protein
MEGYKGRRLLVATMHQKEKVLTPLLESALGVICETVLDFDTDVFGTFSGERERNLSPLETARQKCYEALKKSTADLVIASEGSFGPHPTASFIPADEEWLLLIDVNNQHEVYVRHLSAETNFNGSDIRTVEELQRFAKACGFPDHGIILRKSKTDYQNMHKGIQDAKEMVRIFNDLMQHSKSVYVETDMRACYNPTRMKVIKETAKHLVEKLKRSCPNCGTPGLDEKLAKPGLPCALCGFPTRSVLSIELMCQKCNYSKEMRHPNGKITEDPMYCDFCNP